MKLAEIEALAEGLAPVIRDLMAVVIKPLADENAALARRIVELESIDHGATIKAAIDEAVAAIQLPVDGKDGAPGRDGADGAPGEPGEKGEPGEPGKDGSDGPPGRDGVDGKDGEPGKDGKDGVDGKDGRDGVDGKDADPAEVERLVTETVERVLATWERPKDGNSFTLEDVSPLVEEAVTKAVEALPSPEPGKDGAPGKLPVAKAWAEGVTYEADVRTHNGALWQAVRDTGREPGDGDDWICLAAAGRDGNDADQIEVRGTWDATSAYRRLNIVALNGGAFIARKDEPGPCPGEGWQVIAMRGKPGQQGAKGERGAPGERGPSGPGALHLQIDDNGLMTLVNGDGSTVECDLYPLLSKIAG